MRAVVHVTLKKTVLDPQGRTICSALSDQGFDQIKDVRQGKYFEIQFADGLDKAQAEQQIDRVAREVLANPVIEQYTVDVES